MRNRMRVGVAGVIVSYHRHRHHHMVVVTSEHLTHTHTHTSWQCAIIALNYSLEYLITHFCIIITMMNSSRQTHLIKDAWKGPCARKCHPHALTISFAAHFAVWNIIINRLWYTLRASLVDCRLPLNRVWAAQQPINCKQPEKLALNFFWFESSWQQKRNDFFIECCFGI